MKGSSGGGGIGSFLGPILGIAGMALGGPLGGMAGGALGSMLGGATSGGWSNMDQAMSMF